MRFAKETMVGVFVLVGLLCVGYLTIKLGRMEVFGQQGYTVYANFDTASGLRVGANVEMAGVTIGRVAAINLDNGKARVDMRINDGVPLDSAVSATVKTSGLIGDKLIGLNPGAATTLLTDGSVIAKAQSGPEIEAMLSGLAEKFGLSSFTQNEWYLLHATFTSVAGLRSGAAVDIAGVRVGTVTNIYLDPTTGMATVDMHINKNVELSDDTMASIKSTSLIGDKYISLALGGSDTLFKNGATISDTESSVSIEDLISKYVFGGV